MTLVVEVTNFTTTLENDWVIGAVSATSGFPGGVADNGSWNSA